MTDILNSEQRAPAWQPDQLAGFKVGDQVRLPSLAVPLKVIDLAPPALLILESPSGHQLRAGWRACAKVRTRADMERNRHIESNQG